jgi:hypothetical protein
VYITSLFLLTEEPRKSRIRTPGISQPKLTGWVIGVSRSSERIWILGRSLGIILIVDCRRKCVGSRRPGKRVSI